MATFYRRFIHFDIQGLRLLPPAPFGDLEVPFWVRVVPRSMFTGCLLKWVSFYTKNCHFESLRLHCGYLGHHFGDPGIQGDTQWTHWGPGVKFYRFWGAFGDAPGICFVWISVIWDAQMGGRYQVHVSSDSGMEMMLESDGWMCDNHNKNGGFLMVLLFHLFSRVMSAGMIVGVISVSFGDPRFFWFRKVLGQA